MDSEFIKWLATLGVGGVLAGFMFTFYRKDIKQYTELWRATTDMLIGVVKENTSSSIKLAQLIEQQEHNHIRKSDLDSMIKERIQDVINFPVGPVATKVSE